MSTNSSTDQEREQAVLANTAEYSKLILEYFENFGKCKTIINKVITDGQHTQNNVYFTFYCDYRMSEENTGKIIAFIAEYIDKIEPILEKQSPDNPLSWEDITQLSTYQYEYRHDKIWMIQPSIDFLTDPHKLYDIFTFGILSDNIRYNHIKKESAEKAIIEKYSEGETNIPETKPFKIQIN